MDAIIGGSGLAKLAELVVERREVVRTPFGDPSCALSFGRVGQVPVVFLARHGYGHTIAPHQINYRANLWALREVGVTRIFAVASVGGIREDFGPGTIALPDQLIDYTYGRKSTYFEGPDNPVTHIDFTRPYDEATRQALMAGARAAGETVALGGTYGCMQGPRLETAAEIRRLDNDGCDLVGMTGMPETALARELELPYAVLAVVVNHAAGRGDSREAISLSAMQNELTDAMARVRRILVSTLNRSVATG